MRAPLPYSDFRLQYLPDKGVLWVRGWLLFLDGPADRIEGPEMQEAFPHIPDAEMSGIEMHVPAPDLKPGPDEVAMIPAALNLHQDVWILRKA